VQATQIERRRKRTLERHRKEVRHLRPLGVASSLSHCDWISLDALEKEPP
jgi:hypothetical protein